MTFTSIVFLIFFTVFILLWANLKKREARWFLLTIASFFFYGWWDWYFLGLLIATGFFDFVLAIFIDRAQSHSRKRFLMCFSVISNLSVLFLFKYAVFFSKNFEAFMLNFGVTWNIANNIPAVLLILPIGISFYTFESLSYTIDVYHGHIKPTRNVFQYFAFLSMFPRLVAGPIERPANLLPQMESNKPPSQEMIWKGFNLVLFGYFKKLVIADNLAPLVNQAFESSTPLSGYSWWIAMLSFSIQIYCDFSGYSDIARGLANFMGFDFKLNFNSPYIAQGFSDFWRRWHISLSSWFRDYLYIPLGGSKVSRVRAHVNSWITMLVSGFWHGANWTFVVWGGMHALYLSVEKELAWDKFLLRKSWGKYLVAFITFILATLAWVFFRAETLTKGVEVTKAMLLMSDGAKMVTNKQIILILLPLLPQWYELNKNKTAVEFYLPNWIIRIAMSVMILLCIYYRGPGSTFIYFQF